MVKRGKHPANTNHFFEETRKKISDKLHLIAMIVAIPACTMSGIRLITIGFKPLFLLDVIFAIVVTLTYIYRNRFNYYFRIVFLLAYFFLMGIFSLHTFGLMGLGLLILFIASVILTALFGIRYGMVASAISVITVGFYLYAFYKHWIVIDINPNSLVYDGYHLLTRGIFFFSYLIVTIIIIGYINRSFALAYQKLGVSESRFNLAISSVDEVVWDFDFTNRNFYVSSKFEEVVRITSQDQFKSLKDWLFRIHPDDRSLLLERMRSHKKGESPTIWVEYRFKDDHGQWQWLQTRAKIVERNANGSPARLVGTHANITYFKKLHDELVEIENRYRTLFLMANDPILIIGKQGLIIDANLNAAKVFGYTADSIIGQNIVDLCSKSDSNSKRFTELFANNSDIISNNRYELTMLRGKADPFPVEVSIASITDFGENLHQVVINDLTLQRRFEREKINAVAEMEERERQRLASNLHDDVGPLLSSLNIYLSLLANHKGNQDELVASMQDILRDTIASVREISHNLSPQNLLTDGLVIALTRHFERYNSIINIHFVHNLENQLLTRIIEITCYRVLKEFLNNTIKYANASNVYVKLFLENSKLTLIYTHDGEGFDFKKEMQKSKGIGLINIVERLDSIKAKYRVNSEPLKKGFSFELTMNV